jgi:2,3-diaminopropionate biosynthesis protein SbnA
LVVIKDPSTFNVGNLFIDLSETLSHPLLLKCEGFNFGGSIKMKAATRMVSEAELSGSLHPGRRIVESSSGNLGVALSVIAANRGYRFTCVTDVRCNTATVAAMRAFGTDVRVIHVPDPVRGFLGARLDLIHRLCAEDPAYLWMNQYTNPANWRAHYETTAREIIAEVPDLDVLFVGAGTTGTITGCARFMADHCPDVRVVGIDSVGSVNFGGPAELRLIPGLGSSIPPTLLDPGLLADFVHVKEIDTIRTCRLIASAGYLFGGSTGTVVAGAIAWLNANPADRPLRAVAISPDLGERYLSTVYSDGWLKANYPTVNERTSQETTANG